MLPNGNMQYTLHSLKYCTGPVLGVAGLAGEKNFRSPVVHDGGGKYAFMMPGWFKIFGLVLLAGVFLGGCAGPAPSKYVSLNKLDSLKCERVEILDLYENPAPYENKKLCLTAYIYYAPEFIYFSNDRVPDIGPLYHRNEGILLGNIKQDIWEDLANIPQGTRVLLRGKMTYNHGCWERASLPENKDGFSGCFPTVKPIYFNGGKVYFLEEQN